MPDLDRLVSSLLGSDVDLDRKALLEHGAAIVDEVAPLAPADAVRRAVDAIVGLGPLEPLMADEGVSDILVNGPGDVWIERKGSLERSDVTFRTDDDIVALVRRVITPLGLRIDRAVPAVDARLPDGSRLHALIPPAAVDGPVLAIRRFVGSVDTLEDLVGAGSVTSDDARRLGDVVASRANVLVAGATGAGKTTMLNVLVGAIDDGERIVTVEDAAELRPVGHAVRLEARPPNVEGAGGITLRSLVRHALRLRPDRIVVGEVRGPEALDLLTALTTGHRGSMSTIHAHTADEALARLETLAAMAPEQVPHAALAGLVASAIDVVVVMERDRSHRRVGAIERVAP